MFIGKSELGSAIDDSVKIGSDAIPPDCHGRNFWRDDRAVRELLSLYLDPAELEHFRPHFDRLGALAGGRLDELAALANKNPPVLRVRDRFGREEDSIDYHYAYREMERIAWSDFGLVAMSHRPGVLGWPQPISPVAKYTFTYLFTQAEFGLMCPVNGSDTAARIIFEHGDENLKARLANVLSQNMDEVIRVTQWMTEKAGGSDVGTIDLRAEPEGGAWRLYGEKWFCSVIDAEYALVLARPVGAQVGTRGLGLFAVPRQLDDGSRNHYRIVRLKDKLGTLSMATGEVIFDGALAYVLGDVSNGIKLALTPINLSRLSHGVRAAAMMRRCLNEAMQVARHRVAFKKRIIEHPLMRRSLVKLMVPTEQALSTYMFIAATMRDANAGDQNARTILRIATALLKFRACRDNIHVATGAMEVRGGLGYIDDWVNPRLVRDAQAGLLWEGTSNINALDVVTRAVRKVGAEKPLLAAISERLKHEAIPSSLRDRLASASQSATSFVRQVADDPAREAHARTASSMLYHALSASLLAWEGAETGKRGGDARRLLLSWMVLRHRFERSDPFDLTADQREQRAIDLLLDDEPIDLATATSVLAD